MIPKISVAKLFQMGHPIFMLIGSERRFKGVALVILFILGFWLWEAEAGKFDKIEVEGLLKTELNQVLKATIDLHNACHSQDDDGIEASLTSVITSIDGATRHVEMAKDQRVLLIKMLEAAKTQLEMTKSQSGVKRQTSLKEAFNQLAQIAQVFALDEYKVFFCPKDKATWIQTGWKAQNPVNPDKFADCGKRVR